MQRKNLLAKQKKKMYSIKRGPSNDRLERKLDLAFFLCTQYHLEYF